MNQTQTPTAPNVTSFTAIKKKKYSHAAVACDMLESGGEGGGGGWLLEGTLLYMN